MSLIQSTRLIPLPAAKVYAAAKQVERFPEVLPNLDSAEVLEDDGQGNTVTRWVGTFAVGPLTKSVSWTERDRWDDAALACHFDLISGDMKEYNGAWNFKDVEGGCQANLDVNFTLGIPVLGPLVNAIVDKLMKQNCDELLQALEELAASDQ
jgi:ribosome-associated toxin RatA of RatAB toxin-antitoxin module